MPNQMSDATKGELNALNNGQQEMEDLVAKLRSKSGFLRAGNAYRELLVDGVSIVKGELVVAYKLGAKIDLMGNAVVAKPRKAKAVTTPATSGRK